MTTLRLTLISILLCGLLYVPAILAFGKIVLPEKANGSLVTDEDGKIAGSRLIAQSFTSERYFHPRPSACDYNAQAASGSNLSPTNPALTTRAQEIIKSYQADTKHPIPADLVTASGSGLDPHITRAAAEFQIDRIAAARGLNAQTIRALLPNGPIVNVLEINLALDHAKR